MARGTLTWQPIFGKIVYPSFIHYTSIPKRIEGLQ